MNNYNEFNHCCCNRPTPPFTNTNNSYDRIIFTGITGPTGPQGPIGPTGPTGATGPQGPAGEDAVNTPGPAVADLDATADLATVITTVNDLLASLRTAGLIEQ